MLQSFIVYYSTLLLMLLALRGCYREKESKLLLNFGIGSFIAILIYTFVMGVRYGVGMDYFGYLNVYKQAILYGGSAVERFEPAFKYLIIFLAKFNIHFSIFFAFVAFLQMFFVFKAFKKNKEILPYIVLGLFGGGILSWQNGLRQIIAVTIFIYAIQYITNKDWKRYYLCVLLAFLFHKSAILLVIIYPIFVVRWHEIKFSLLMQNIAVLTSVAIGEFIDKIMQVVLSQLGSLLILMRYEGYEDSDIMVDSTRGLGYFSKLIMVLVVVNFSNKIKEYYKDTPYSIFYTLFFLGYIFSNLVIGSVVLQRPNYYFSGLYFIVIAFTLAYLQQNKRNSINRLLYAGLIIMLIFFSFSLVTRGEISTSRYFFFWQESINSYNFINMR